MRPHDDSEGQASGSRLEQDGYSDYRGSACDQLLESLDEDSDSGICSKPADPDGLLRCCRDDVEPEPGVADLDNPHKWRVFLIRTLALLCACSLSVGSHYATNILGPLKSRLQRELGTSNTEFGLLLAAYSLNSTWTPLVGGVLASRLGTTMTSILATGIIFLGQILLLCGDIMHNMRLMALGLFIFGFGVSPLAVVQETIIVRFFKSQGLGISMAFGLIAGKGASFISARTSYPLTERFGPSAPFYVATSLAGLSVVTNLIYVASSRWLIDGGEAELEAPDITAEAKRRRATGGISGAEALEKVAEKKKVHFRQIYKLGDVFWTYMALNLFCGMIWSPFVHLASNIIQHRYDLPEDTAATNASYLLAGPILLYPICGYLVDRYRQRPIVIRLLLLSSFLTLISYIWFAAAPTWTKTPIPAVISYAFGHGFAPLLLVVLVPNIVPSKYISTALGAHKSLEQTGSALFQPLSGLLLDKKDPNSSSLQRLLNIFVLLNVLQLVSILALAYFQQVQLRSPPPCQIRQEDLSGQETPLLSNNSRRYSTSSSCGSSGKEVFSVRTTSELKRGKIFGVLSILLVVTAWVIFLTTAWFKLGEKK